MRSSAGFLLPPSMLKGRNQPEGAGGAAPDEGAGGIPLTESAAPAKYTAHGKQHSIHSTNSSNANLASGTNILVQREVFLPQTQSGTAQRGCSVACPLHGTQHSMKAQRGQHTMYTAQHEVNQHLRSLQCL